jgi:hypothetical protein
MKHHPSRQKVEEKLEYMHLNPVRAGLVERAEEYRWSSALWYLEGKSVGLPIGWPSSDGLRVLSPDGLRAFVTGRLAPCRFMAVTMEAMGGWGRTARRSLEDTNQCPSRSAPRRMRVAMRDIWGRSADGLARVNMASPGGSSPATRRIAASLTLDQLSKNSELPVSQLGS